MSNPPRVGVATFLLDRDDGELRLSGGDRVAEELLGFELSQGTPFESCFPGGLRLLNELEQGASVLVPSPHGAQFDATAFRLSPDMVTVVVSDAAKRVTVLAERLARVEREYDRFAFVVSHDLRAPVRGIRLAAQWLASDLVGRISAESQENLDFVTARVRWLTTMFDALLAHYRVRRREPAAEPFDLGAVVRSVAAEFDTAQGHRIEVAPAWPQVCGDAGMVSEVLHALVENATIHHDTDAGRISVGWREVPGAHEIFVRDDGPGIPPKHYERVFELFGKLQRREDVDTVGAGLAMSEAIVRRWGGTLTVAAAEPRGAEFRITLPLRGRPASIGIG